MGVRRLAVRTKLACIDYFGWFVAMGVLQFYFQGDYLEDLNPYTTESFD